MLSDKYFAREIENRIGVQIDTSTIDKEIANYEGKLKEVDLNKVRLEREIDNLPHLYKKVFKNKGNQKRNHTLCHFIGFICDFFCRSDI